MSDKFTGFRLSEMAKWPPKRPVFHPAPRILPNLSACPTCSHASPGMVHFIRRPMLICGQRSGVWMLVGAPGCTHCDHRKPEYNSLEAEPLVARWNDYAKRKAAIVCERRGLSPDRAAYFLAALVDPKL